MNYAQFRDEMDALNREWLRGWRELDDGAADDIKSALYELEGQYQEFIPVYHYDLEMDILELACGL